MCAFDFGREMVKAGCDEKALRMKAHVPTVDEKAAGWIAFGALDFVSDHLRAITPGLLFAATKKFRPGDAVGKSEIILNFRLVFPERFLSVNHQRAPHRAREIDGSGQTSEPAANNDDVPILRDGRLPQTLLLGHRLGELVVTRKAHECYAGGRVTTIG